MDYRNVSLLVMASSPSSNVFQDAVEGDAMAVGVLTPKRCLSRFSDFATSRRDARQLLVAQGRVS